MKKLRESSGQILIEALVCSTLIFFSVILGFEMVRRNFLELILHHSSFLRAREVGIHLPPQKKKEIDFWLETLGSNWARNLKKNATVEEVASGEGKKAKVWYRFPALFRFRVRDFEKHHFEVTKKCLFRSSSP